MLPDTVTVKHHATEEELADNPDADDIEKGRLPPQK
jgi:hypothetical protein